MTFINHNYFLMHDIFHVLTTNECFINHFRIENAEYVTKVKFSAECIYNLISNQNAITSLNHRLTMSMSQDIKLRSEYLVPFFFFFF